MNEELYLVAYKDIEQKEIDEALWLKAMSIASGDKQRAKWAYIELRVDQMVRDPSLRRSASKKVRKPTHQSGAYMMWFSIFFSIAIISIAAVLDFDNLAFNITNGLKFLDIPSLLFVFCTSIFFGIAATSWRTYWRCWTYTFGRAKRVSIHDARSVVRCMNVMGNSAWKMGIVGTLIGGALLLQSWGKINNVNEALTVAFLTLVYGLIFKLFCYVAEQRVMNHYVN
ncbi:MAG: hypothetical protein P8L36_14025 [SAR324 cluster bacterium]|nr:hypothetical protein [SAR324 cluster bacterium]